MRFTSRPLLAVLCGITLFAFACTTDGGGDASCGNARIEGGEACDDGNRRDGDGCDAACRVEAPATDCAGVAGGEAVHDHCGRCVGGTTGKAACVQDCAGVWGGTASTDQCGACVGGTTGQTACVQDCTGVWGGTGSVDHCGACVGGTTGQTACAQDCVGVWGGTASTDQCGACVGGTTGQTACAQDCAGVWGGTASTDQCGACVGGTTGRNACTQDCAGVWGGTASTDHCGTCTGGTTGNTACAQDCAGVWGGTASTDQCGVCVGGTTGRTACTQDCSGVWGGTASVDRCGVCTGGTTGRTACTQDCSGVWGGTASVDRCGVCTGGTTGQTACTQDCAGVWGGTAQADGCNRCTGGTTGRVACSGQTCPLGAGETVQALVDNPACEVVALPEGLFRGPIRVELARMGGKSAVEVRGSSRDGTVVESGGPPTFQIGPDATLRITSLTIRGDAGVPGASGLAGSAVYNRGTATLDGVAVTRNIGSYTGAITNEHRMEIRSSIVSENVNRGTSAFGGAIYNSGVLYVGGSAITGNEALSTGLNYGGGVCNDGGSVTIEDSEVAGNRASNGIRVGGTMEGGGIFSVGGALDVRRSRIHHNRVENAGNGAHGGGIAAWGSTVTLSADSEVSFNELVADSLAYGAGIYLQDHAQLHADGVTFEGNVGQAKLWVGGAAVMAKQTSLRLAGNRLANNRLEVVTSPSGGQLLGGVLYVREGTLKMSGGQLVGNTMRNGWVQGGLVRVDEYTYPSEADEALELEGVTIADNVVSTSGNLDGGLLSAVRTLRLTDCDIHSNAVTSAAQYGSSGGLVHFRWSRETTTPLLPGALAVEGTRVAGNTVASTNGVSGGLLYAYLARTSPVVVTLASSTFVDNTVSSVRGVTRGGLFQLEEARHVAIVDSVLRANTITSGVDGGSTMNPGLIHGGLLYQMFTTGSYADPASDPDGKIALVRTDVSRNRVGTSLATDAVQGGLFMLYVPWHSAGHLFTFSATNSTIAENVVQARSAVNGGILNVFNRDGSDVLVDLSNATLALNQTNGPLGTIFNFGEPPTSPSYRAAVVRLRNTILARNDAPGGADCPLQGPLSTTTSSGHNLLGDVTACAGMTPASTDLVGQDPLFGASGDHGGPVPSLPIAPESPAVDGGDPAGCVDATGVLLSTDQRGFPRPSGARCDIGAFELQLP